MPPEELGRTARLPARNVQNHNPKRWDFSSLAEAASVQFLVPFFFLPSLKSSSKTLREVLVSASYHRLTTCICINHHDNCLPTVSSCLAEGGREEGSGQCRDTLSTPRALSFHNAGTLDSQNSLWRAAPPRSSGELWRGEMRSPCCTSSIPFFFLLTPDLSSSQARNRICDFPL